MYRNLKQRFTNFLFGKMHITCYWEDAVCFLLAFYLVYDDPTLPRNIAQGLWFLIAILWVLPAWDCWKNRGHQGKNEEERMTSDYRWAVIRIAFLLLTLFLTLRWHISAGAFPVLYKAMG